MADNIKVVIKVRPLIRRELDDNLQELWAVNDNKIYPIEQHRDGDNTFTFDHIFDSHSHTTDVYDTVARPIVEAAVDGINGTIFAYGQTSSGKTYTMMGGQDSPGVLTLAVKNIFEKIESMTERDFLLRVSYIEIYNEKIKDLLDTNNVDLKIQEDYNGNMSVKAKEQVTATPEEVLDLMKKGNRNRAVGETAMNERSSRSHTIFYIIIESRRHVSRDCDDDDSVNVSQLNLVDLAGSERAGQTGATKQRLREGGHINKSLSSLGLVIRQLSDPTRGPNAFISFRDSKLTHFLRNSLGGNSKTGIICAVTPAAFDETQSTLMFAMSAKVIQNIPQVNAVISDATLIKKLTKNMAKLQEELENKKLLEDDNKKLQEELNKLRNMILMGNAENVVSLNQKAATLRRRTWGGPNLQPISENRVAQTPLLKERIPAYKSILENYNRIENKLAAPKANNDLLDSSNSIIELVDTPDASPKVHQSSGSTTPPICSPNHKCFNVQQTPPCILKYRTHHAEKEYMELEEMTTLEKMYAPQVVELINELRQLKQEKEKCTSELESQNIVILESQKEIHSLKSDLKLSEKIKGDNEEIQKNLQSEITKYQNINTDLQFEIESLTQRSQSREKELLTSLKEARESLEKSHVHARPSLVPQFLNVSDNLLPGSTDNVTSPSNTDTEDVSKRNEEIITLKSEIETLTSKINILSNDLEERNMLIERLECQIKDLNQNDMLKSLENEISSLQQQVSDSINENTLLKQEIHQSEEKLSNLSVQFNDKGKEIDTLNTTITQLKGEISMLISDNEEKLSTLAMQHEDKIKEIDNLNTPIAQLKEEMSMCNTVNEEKLSTLAMQHEDKIKEIDNLNTIIAQLKDEMSMSNTVNEEKLSTLAMQHEDKVKEIDLLNTTITKLKEEISIFNSVNEEKLSTFPMECDDKIKEIDNLNTTIAQLKEEMSMSNTVKEEKLSNLAMQHEEKVKEIDSLNATIAHLKEELSMSNTVNEEKLSTLAMQHEDKIKEIDNLNTAIAQLKEEMSMSNTVNEEKLSTLAMQHEDKVKEIDILNTSVTQLKDEISLLKSYNLSNEIFEENMKSKDDLIMELQEEFKIKLDIVSQENINKDHQINMLTNENNNLNMMIQHKNSELEELRVQIKNKLNTYEIIHNEKDMYKDESKRMVDLVDKLTVANLVLESEIGKVRNSIQLKDNENSVLIERIDSLSKIIDDNNSNIMKTKHKLENALCDANKLSEELQESKNNVSSCNTVIDELRNSNNIIESNFENVISDIKFISNKLSHNYSNIDLFTNSEELNFLILQVNKLIDENISLQHISLTSEDKENLSFKIEKSPLKNMQHIVKDATLMDTLNITRSPKSITPQKDNKNDVKYILGLINSEIDSVDEAKSLSPPVIPSAELTLVRNKINNLKATLLQLKEKKCYESEYNEAKECLSIILCKVNEIHSVISSDPLHADLYSMLMKHFNSIVTCGEKYANPNIIDNDVYINIKSNIEQQSKEFVNSFVNFIEESLLDMHEKINQYRKLFTSIESDTVDVTDDLNSKIMSTKSLCDSLRRKIEMVIADQSQTLEVLENQNTSLKEDKLLAETEIHSLCQETEMLFKKVQNMKSDAVVSEAETSLRNNILYATEHYHNNLHNTFINTLSFFKEQLFELQNYLQNPSTAQRDIIDVYCNIATPGLELVDTPIKDCSTRIVETKTSSIPIKLFDVQASDLEKHDKETSTDLQDSNLHEENLQLLSKLKSLEYLQLQYNDLVAERDDLSTQLMDNLEDLENYKVKCAALENKMEFCTCTNDKKSNDSSSQTNEHSVDDNNVISKCKEYLVNILLELKEDVDTANKDLFDLMSDYNTVVDNHSKLLSNNIKSLEEQLSQKHNEYCISQQQVDVERSQIKSQINLLEQKIEELEREKNNLAKSADEHADNVNILKSEIDKLVTEKTHAMESNSEIEIKYQNELKVFNEKIDKLTSNNVCLTNEITNLQTSMDKLLEEQLPLKSSLSEKDAMCQTLKEELNALEEFKEKLQLEIETHIEEKSTQSLHIEELKNKLEDTEKQFLETIKTLAEENKSLENTCAKLREQELSLISSLNELKTTQNRVSDESATKQFEITSLKEKCIELQNIICNKEELLNNLYTQQDENQKELNHTKEELRNCITEKTAMEEEKKTLSGHCNQLQNLISEKELLIVNLTTQIEKVNVRLETMENELSSHKTHLQALEEEKSSLAADKVALMNECNEIKTLISNKELFISNMSSQIEEGNKQLNAAREEIHKYISDKKILEEEKLSLMSNNEGLIQILNEKDVEIQEKQSEIGLLKSNHRSTASLQFENEKIKHEIIKKDECIRSLEEQLVRMNNKLHGIDNLMNVSGGKTAKSKTSDLQSELKLNTKSWDEHLHLKRQSLHDTHRNLSSSNEDCSDVTMEECCDNKTNSEELENRCKALEDKCKELDLLHCNALESLDRKSQECDHINALLMNLQVKFDEEMKKIETKINCKVDASTNTCNNRPEDNPALMNIFVDKMTYNHLKEKYEKLVKMNEELRFKHKEQATELRRLQHSLQENTIQKLLPHDQEKKNISKLENEVSELKYQLKSKQKKYEELEDKYKEMDGEYDTCAKLYHESVQSYNQLSSEKLLLEAELENLRGEMRSRKESPGKETRKKRQSLHDSHRGLYVAHTDVGINTSPIRDIAHVKPCTDCGNNQLKLEELKLQNKDLLKKLSTQVPVPVVVPGILPLPPLVGSGIVQNQHLSNYLAENEKLKMRLAEYKKYIIKLKSTHPALNK